MCVCDVCVLLFFCESFIRENENILLTFSCIYIKFIISKTYLQLTHYQYFIFINSK